MTDTIPPTTPPPDQKPVVIPKLRPGITFMQGDNDAEGRPQWLIHDTGRNKFFIIGWIEYELLQRWAWGNAEKIIDSINKETTLHVDRDDIENLSRFLTHNYLVQQTGYQIYQQAKEQQLFKNDSLFHWLISYYLFFKIPLFHPNQFLDRTKHIADFVFSRKVAYVMLVLGLIALFQLNVQWDQFIHTFHTIVNWEGFFLTFIAYITIKLFHELGHAYMCKRYGVPVPALGVAFLVFWPVLYTDTTLSWSLDNKKRMRIALAGIWVETYLTIFALLIWCNVHNTTIQTICYVTIAVNWMASLLINVSPFMRFDGYYVLADFLNIPNLQPRAFALTRWQIRHWLFHWSDPPPEKFSPKMHRFLVAYSIFTWLYRLGVYFGIAVLVYHFFIKIVGIALFAVELFYFILGPIVRELQTWVQFKDKFSFNTRTKLTIGCLTFLLFLFFLPISDSIEFPGTVSYKHTFLVSPAEGTLKTLLPPVGTTVKANQPIVIIHSPELDNALRQTQLEYQKQLNELRRASINSRYTSQKSILLSNINKQQSKYKKLMELRQELTLTVPFNGIIYDVAAGLHPGAAIMKDEWIADIVDPSHIEGEGYVSQIDVNNLRVGLEGYFYPHDLSESKVPLKISSIEILNSSKLACQYASELKQNKKQPMVPETPCYNASDLGGAVPTFVTEEGDYVPVNSVFRVILTANNAAKLSHVERGTMVINTQSNSLAHRFFYMLKTAWIKEGNL